MKAASSSLLSPSEQGSFTDICVPQFKRIEYQLASEYQQRKLNWRVAPWTYCRHILWCSSRNCPGREHNSKGNYENVQAQNKMGTAASSGRTALKECSKEKRTCSHLPSNKTICCDSIIVASSRYAHHSYSSYSSS